MKKSIFKFIRKCATRISPTFNTKLCYFVKFRRMLNLKHPITFNEKILWLKLNTYLDNDLIKQCADKYRVRKYVNNLGIGEILNEMIAAYDRTEEIDWNNLPKQFAIKFNVGCGCNIICSDKKKLNINSTIKEINSWFKKNQWIGYSEMQYKDVAPKIIVEKYLGKQDGSLPEDYKFYCFDGKAQYVMVCIGRDSESPTKYCMYDRNWNWHPLDTSCLEDPHLEKPKHIDTAFDYAEKLSAGFPFVRTDLYLVEDKIYFGELTFTPSGGLDNDILPNVDIDLGKKIKI